jgi:Bacterial oxidoreductases, C-terminal
LHGRRIRGDEPDPRLAASLSFNAGPLCARFRSIYDIDARIAGATNRFTVDDRFTGRFIGRFIGRQEKVDVSKAAVLTYGIALQDREFFAAIAEAREPNASVAQVLACYKILHQLDQQLNQAR